MKKKNGDARADGRWPPSWSRWPNFALGILRSGTVVMGLAGTAGLAACAPYVPEKVYNETVVVARVDGVDKTIRHVNACHALAVPHWDDYAVYLYQDNQAIPLARRGGTDIIMMAPRTCTALHLRNPGRNDVERNAGNFSRFGDKYWPLFVKLYADDPLRLTLIFSRSALSRENVEIKQLQLRAYFNSPGEESPQVFPWLRPALGKRDTAPRQGYAAYFLLPVSLDSVRDRIESSAYRRDRYNVFHEEKGDRAIRNAKTYYFKSQYGFSHDAPAWPDRILGPDQTVNKMIYPSEAAPLGGGLFGSLLGSGVPWTSEHWSRLMTESLPADVIPLVPRNGELLADFDAAGTLDFRQLNAGTATPEKLFIRIGGTLIEAREKDIIVAPGGAAYDVVRTTIELHRR
jgi:hypothetical protein